MVNTKNSANSEGARLRVIQLAIQFSSVNRDDLQCELSRQLETYSLLAVSSNYTLMCNVLNIYVGLRQDFKSTVYKTNRVPHNLDHSYDPFTRVLWLCWATKEQSRSNWCLMDTNTHLVRQDKSLRQTCNLDLMGPIGDRTVS